MGTSPYLLFVLKRSYICYYFICMTVLLAFSKLIWNELSDVISETQKVTEKIVDVVDGIKIDKEIEDQIWENAIKY